MGKWEKKADVPGTSTQAICSFRDCKKPAWDHVTFQVELMGKQINCKKPVCPEHLKLCTPTAESYSIDKGA